DAWNASEGKFLRLPSLKHKRRRVSVFAHASGSAGYGQGSSRLRAGRRVLGRAGVGLWRWGRGLLTAEHIALCSLGQPRPGRRSWLRRFRGPFLVVEQLKGAGADLRAVEAELL